MIQNLRAGSDTNKPFSIKKNNRQSICKFRLVNDDIESLYKIVPDIFGSFYKVVSVFVSLS